MKRANPVAEGKQLEKSRFSRTNDEETKDDNKSSSDKKPRLCWTPELHSKFEEAFKTLLAQNSRARPKEILRLMNVPNLTTTHVSSHMQKYQARQLRIKETGATDLPSLSKSSNLHGRTEIARQIENQSFLLSVSRHQSSNLGPEGKTQEVQSNSLSNAGWYAGHERDLRADLPSSNKSSRPYGNTEIARQYENQSFLPSVLIRQSSNIGSGGNALQFHRDFLSDAGFERAGFERDPVLGMGSSNLGCVATASTNAPTTMNQFLVRPECSNAQVSEMGLPSCTCIEAASLNTTMDQFPAGMERGGAQNSEMGSPDLSYMAAAFSNTPTTKDWFSTGREWSSAQISKMGLPNLSDVPTAPNTPMTMDPFSIRSKWSNARTPEMGLPNLSCIATGSPITLKPTDPFPAVTAALSQELDVTKDRTAYFGSKIQNQFPLGSSGSTKEEEYGHRQTSLGGSTSESLHQQTVAGLAPPARWLIQDQHEDELAELLRMLEEDPKECNGSGPDPDQYCKQLEEILRGNDIQH